MNWKIYFTQSILNRGYEYYRKKKVKGVLTEGNTYRAFVLGSHVYHTEVTLNSGYLIDAKCDCPYAEDGYYCKHMAALLFHIEETDEQETQQLKNEKKIRPFEQSKDIYQYFDMGRIAKDIEIEESKIHAAKSLIDEKRVVLDRVSIDYRRFFDRVEKCGYASGTYFGDRGRQQLSCLFDRDTIIRIDCSYWNCQSYTWEYSFTRNLCIHQLALLLLVADFLNEKNPGDSTDYNAVHLLAGFRNQEGLKNLELQGDEVKDFHMEPVLEKNDDDIYLTLKAGIDKLYVVKNITNLISQYEARDIITFGTKTQIDFAKHRISQDSEELFQYVRKIIRDENNRIKHSRNSYDYYYEGEEIKQKFALYGRRLDQLYDLYQDTRMECNDKTGRKTVKKSYLFAEEKPNITLTIAKDMDNENILHGIHVTGKVPDLIPGEDYKYFFSKESLNRVSEEAIRMIDPLLDLEDNGRISFDVGRRNLSEFYHHVLPVLKENVKVRELDAQIIQEIVPPDATYSFYLDVENEEISCKTEVQYDEEKYSLLDNMREGLNYQWIRNAIREQDILSQIRKYFPIVDLDKDELLCEKNEEAIVALLDGGIDRLMALGEVNTTERFRKMNIRQKPKLKIGVSIKSDLMNLTVSSDDIDQEELLQLLKNYQRKKKYYRLKNGDLITVSGQDIEMLQQLMESMQLSLQDLVKGNMKIPMYRALYLNKMLEQGENIYLNRDSHFKNLIKEFKTVDDSEFEVPDNLSNIMRGYQIHGFKWLKTLERYRFGGILADDMGLGKTLQAIALLEDAKLKENKQTALIITPASLVYNWKEEFHKYAPNLDVNLIVGSQQERVEMIHNYQDYDVLVTSYDLLKRDIAEYEDAAFAYQIIDEAQYIKNHTTAAAKSVKIISSKHRFALTGTPIENRLSELWSIFDYLMPGFLYRYETFRKDMETPIVKYKDEDASNQLRKMVAPFILRRLKEDVLSDLPDKLEEVRYAKLESEQQKLYDGQVIRMRKMLEAQRGEDFQKNKIQVLAELTKIRQICCDPNLLFDKYDGGSAKKEACMDLIQSAIEGEHKILVFSQFTSMLSLLEEALKKESIGYYKIIGETPKQKRLEMVNAFNSDNTPVFLISLKAGGTGLNLTGADVVIHYDPWWNQAAQNQATDRAHRIGQTKKISVYKLIVKNTIEEKIVKMQESKRDLADAILSGENGSITQMSKEELMELLEG